MERPFFLHRRARGFTLLEVALIVAIIGMMMLIIVGFLMAPKQQEGVPPKTGTPKTLKESATPAPGAAPATSAEATPPAVPAFR